MRKFAIAISLTIACLVSIFPGGELSVSYYRRWEASKLLAAVRQLHPGTTTEAQVRTSLKPFAGYERKADRQPDIRGVSDIDLSSKTPLHFRGHASLCALNSLTAWWLKSIFKKCK